MPEGPGQAAADVAGDSEALLKALRKLGPRQRAVIVLRFWMDMSEAETAAALDCSVGTVKSQASRALAALRGSAELMEGELQ
jgi:RNA polymerase sigma factor (sigma-70 family)